MLPNLPFAQKALDQIAAAHTAAVNELDGHALLELAVRSLAEVDRAHAALSEEPHDPPGTDTVSFGEGRSLLYGAIDQVRRWRSRSEVLISRVCRLQQFLDFGTQRGIRSAGAISCSSRVAARRSGLQSGGGRAARVRGQPAPPARSRFRRSVRERSAAGSGHDRGAEALVERSARPIEPARTSFGTAMRPRRAP
jgi:hypothetical protein